MNFSTFIRVFIDPISTVSSSRYLALAFSGFSTLSIITMSTGLFPPIAQAYSVCGDRTLALLARYSMRSGEAILTTDWNTGEHFDEKVFISKSSNGTYYMRWDHSDDWFRIDFSGSNFSFTRGDNWQKYVGGCSSGSSATGPNGESGRDFPEVNGSATSYPNLHTARFRIYLR